MAWILIIVCAAVLFIVVLLALLKAYGGPQNPPDRSRNSRSSTLKPRTNPKLTKSEREELLANVRAAAQADPHKTAQLIREWMSEGRDNTDS